MFAQVQYNCPNETNCCHFKGRASEMRDHIKNCESVIVKCCYRRCSWRATLGNLKNHWEMDHPVLGWGETALLQPHAMYLLSVGSAIFLIKTNYNEDKAKFYILYAGPDTQAKLSIQLGNEYLFPLKKTVAVNRMDTFKVAHITFENALVVKFDLIPLHRYLDDARVFGNAHFTISLSAA